MAPNFSFRWPFLLKAALSILVAFSSHLGWHHCFACHEFRLELSQDVQPGCGGQVESRCASSLLCASQPRFPRTPPLASPSSPVRLEGGSGEAESHELWKLNLNAESAFDRNAMLGIGVPPDPKRCECAKRGTHREQCAKESAATAMQWAQKVRTAQSRVPWAPWAAWAAWAWGNGPEASQPPAAAELPAEAVPGGAVQPGTATRFGTLHLKLRRRQSERPGLCQNTNPNESKLYWVEHLVHLSTTSKRVCVWRVTEIVYLGISEATGSRSPSWSQWRIWKASHDRSPSLHTTPGICGTCLMGDDGSEASNQGRKWSRGGAVPVQAVSLVGLVTGFAWIRYIVLDSDFFPLGVEGSFWWSQSQVEYTAECMVAGRVWQLTLKIHTIIETILQPIIVRDGWTGRSSRRWNIMTRSVNCVNELKTSQSERFVQKVFIT